MAFVDALVLRVNTVLSDNPSADPITADQLRTIAFPAECAVTRRPPSTSWSPPSDHPSAAQATPSTGADLLLNHVPDEYRNPRFATTALRPGYALGEVDALIDRLNAAFDLTDIHDRAAVGRILEGLRTTILPPAHGGYDLQAIDE